MEECIFCKIFKGEIKSEKFFESDNFFAIKDIHPKTKGHSLVIPKKHFKNLEEVPEGLMKEFLMTAKKVASRLIEEEKAEGFNIAMNNGKVAGQIINHVHLHILPRYSNDGFRLNI